MFTVQLSFRRGNTDENSIRFGNHGHNRVAAVDTGWCPSSESSCKGLDPAAHARRPSGPTRNLELLDAYAHRAACRASRQSFLYRPGSSRVPKALDANP